MSNATLTTAGLALLATLQSGNQALNIDQFIYANIPGLNTDITPAVDTVKPAAEKIVHTSDVTKVGYVDNQTIIYSNRLDTSIGDFVYNWVGLYSTEHSTLIAVSFIPIQHKKKTVNDILGNTLCKNFGIQYINIKSLANITIAADESQVIEDFFNHNHDTVYAKLNHTHNDKADINHAHDDRYLQEHCQQNLLRNGYFFIWQRGENFTSSNLPNGTVGADGWYVNYAPNKFNNLSKLATGGIKIDFVTTGGTFNNTLRHKLENAPNIATATIKFKGTNGLKIKCMYQNIGSTITTYYGDTFTCDGSVQTFSSTFEVLDGVSRKDLIIDFYEFQTGQELEIYKTKLDEGRTFTGWPYLTYSSELLENQRYYKRLDGEEILINAGYSNHFTPDGAVFINFHHAVPMRVDPTIINTIPLDQPINLQKVGLTGSPDIQTMTVVEKTTHTSKSHSVVIMRTPDVHFPDGNSMITSGINWYIEFNAEL